MAYRILLFVHVMSAIAWLGAGIVFQVLNERAVGARDRSKVQTLVSVGGAFGPKYFGTVSGILFIAGLSMVFVGKWGFDHVFVIGGLVGFAASSVLGARVIGPTVAKLEETVASSPDGDEVFTVAAKLRAAGRVDMAIMVAIVFLMTVKPGP